MRYLLPIPVIILLSMFVACSGPLGCPGNCTGAPPGTIGSCPNGGASGTQGAKCAFDPECNAGLTCVDDTCLACGGENQPCCAIIGGDTCNPGGTCVHSGDWPTCQFNCGSVGLPCCDSNGPICTGGTCDNATQKCVQGNSDPCVAGSNGTSYFVWGIDSACGQHLTQFSAESDASAALCVQQLEQQDPTLTYCNIDQTPLANPVCGEGCSPLIGGFSGATTFYTCNGSQLAACEAALDSSCTSWPPQNSDGTCP